MRKVWIGAARASSLALALGAASLMLSGCDAKETGPEASGAKAVEQR